MVIGIVLTQMLLFLVLEVLAHLMSWNLRQKLHYSMWKIVLVMGAAATLSFHLSANSWMWVTVTAICLGTLHGVLESRFQ
ncbi:MAG: hypothetical protein JWN30_106 [Bacilli bacterium]|nr:hypothetical protein [Bacilli bacterium]